MWKCSSFNLSCSYQRFITSTNFPFFLFDSRSPRILSFFVLTLSLALASLLFLPYARSLFLSMTLSNAQTFSLSYSLLSSLSLPSQIKIRVVARLKHVGGNLVVNDRRQCIKWLLFSHNENFFSLSLVIFSCDSTRLWLVSSLIRSYSQRSAFLPFLSVWYVWFNGWA